MAFFTKKCTIVGFPHTCNPPGSPPAGRYPWCPLTSPLRSPPGSSSLWWTASSAREGRSSTSSWSRQLRRKCVFYFERKRCNVEINQSQIWSDYMFFCLYVAWSKAFVVAILNTNWLHLVVLNIYKNIYFHNFLISPRMKVSDSPASRGS